MLNYSEEEIFSELATAIETDRCCIGWCRDDEELKQIDLTNFLAKYE